MWQKNDGLKLSAKQRQRRQGEQEKDRKRIGDSTTDLKRAKTWKGGIVRDWGDKKRSSNVCSGRKEFFYRGSKRAEGKIRRQKNEKKCTDLRSTGKKKRIQVLPSRRLKSSEERQSMGERNQASRTRIKGREKFLENTVHGSRETGRKRKRGPAIGLKSRDPL